MVDLKTQRLDAVFSAVSDATRRSFLRRLSRREATISELARPLTMSLEAASKHVRVLEKAGLVRRHRSGRAFTVRLTPGPLSEADRWLSHYRAFWTGKLDALATYLEADAVPDPAEESGREADHTADSVPTPHRPAARGRAAIPKKGTRNA